MAATMPMLWRLGYRNLWRNRRRTLLTMSAMGVATALLILTLGIYDGMLWDMVEGATELYHGHAKVMAPGYLDEERMVQTLPDDGLDARLRARPEVAGAAGRVRGFALVSFGDGQRMNSQPAELLGIDPAHERDVTLLHERVVEGHYLSGAATTEIVLGAGLAKRLDAEVGGLVPAMGQGADGSIAQGLFVVVGILDTGDPMRDAMLAVVGRTTLQEFVVLPGQVHEWAVRLHRALDAPPWAAELQAELGDVAEVVPWQEILPLIAQYMELWMAVQFYFALIFYFAVVLVALNTMSMSFFERIREFAVMAALGLRPRKLSGLIMLEGLILSSMAGLVGGAVGAAASFAMYRWHLDLSGVMDAVSFAGTVIQPRLRSYPTAFNIGMPIVLVVGLGIVVALLPALRLRRLKPVEALSEV